MLVYHKNVNKGQTCIRRSSLGQRKSVPVRQIT